MTKHPEKRLKGQWDASEEWYTGCVEEKGHYYHQAILIPAALRILSLKAGHKLLDLGCGSGVFARHLPPHVDYTGIDASKELLKSAERLTHRRERTEFIHADATKKLPLGTHDYDAALFLLSLQNMEQQPEAIQEAARHLKPGGKLLLILNHPCFRIPRQTSWGVDEAAKLQYRKIHSYMTPQAIPIQTAPSRVKTPVTHSYHLPLSSYIEALAKASCPLFSLEEWCSDKKSEGGKARMEDRARREIPLFLSLFAIHQGDP